MVIPISKPLLGPEEQRAVLDVLASGQLTQGPRTAEFERRFAETIGTRHAVAVSSGTAALWLALLAHGVGPGDEVITTGFSFIASANAVLFTGARPVFVDIEERSFNIDPARIESRITPRTKALLPVHLYGYPADMGAIVALAARHGLAVIEDAAQAVGAAVGGKMVGSFGTGCFSLYATKNICTGEGGMITTDDDAIAERCRLLRQHGMRSPYHHEQLGYNFRMLDLQAAIGIVQLTRLEEFNAHRRANASYLTERLRNDKIVTPRCRPGSRHVFHQYTIRVCGGREERDAALGCLRAAGIGAAVYYPVPIHRQPVYLDLGYRDALPVAERLSDEVLSLPVHPAVTRDDLDAIVAEVNRL